MRVPRAVGGNACTVFSSWSEEQVRESLLSFVLHPPPPSVASLFLSPLSFYPLLSSLEAAASSRQSDHNLSCRTFIRSGRCEMCFDVTPLGTSARVTRLARAHPRVCVGRVGAGTSMSPPPSWCGQRLMSPRQSRARACHSDSIRYSSHRLPRLSSPRSPSSFSLSLSFNPASSTLVSRSLLV